MTITRIKNGNSANTNYLVHTIGFDNSNLPTEPSDLPVSPESGDTLIETFSTDFTSEVRVTIHWQFNGSIWEQVGEIQYNNQSYVDILSTYIEVDNPPTAPVNYGTNVSTNYLRYDTLYEEYANGYIIWACDGTTWNFMSMRLLNEDMYFKPENYGHTGSGTSAVQEAIDAAFNAGGGTVLLARNKMYGPITTPLVMKRNVKIIGQSYSTSILKFAAGIDGIVINTTEVYCELDNFTILGAWDTGGVNGPAIHFTSNEPREMRFGRVQIRWWGGVGIQTEFGCNPSELQIDHLWYVFGNPQGSPIINWLGGGSYIKIGSIFFQPDYNSSCTGMYLYNGDFVIDKLNIGGGVIRGIRSEYVNLILHQVNWEPHGNVAQSIYVVSFGVGLNRGSFIVGSVYIAQDLSSLERPHYVYHIDHESPYGILGPVYLGSPVNSSVVFCPNDKSQSQSQFYIGPVSHVNNNGQGKVVALGGLGTNLRVGTSPGGTTFSELAEIYGNLAIIRNASPLFRIWAYSYSMAAPTYKAFELEVNGNSSTGAMRKVGRLVFNVVDSTNNSEDSEVELYVISNGTSKKMLTVTGSSLTVHGDLNVTGSGGGSGNLVTLGVVSSFNMNSVPTTPTSPPSSPSAGDIYIETYNNTNQNQKVIIRWTYNGSVWTMNGTPEYNLKRYYATVSSNLTAGSLPVTPATPGSSTGYVTGDTLLETYTNGHLEWVYGTSSWILSASRVNTNRVSIIKGTGNWDEDGSLPTAPDSTPSSPIINDVIIQSYDNATRNNAVTRYWTYNGTSWVELTNGIHRFNMVFTNSPAVTLTYGVPPTASLAATTTSYVNGDILWEKYTNGYGLYKFNNGWWVLQTHGSIGGDWINLSFGSGWVDYGGAYQTGQVRKVGDLIFLRGLVKRTSGSGTTITTLPSGYRPPAQLLFGVHTITGFGRLDIDTSGNVSLLGGGADWVQLDGLVFSVTT